MKKRDVSALLTLLAVVFFWLRRGASFQHPPGADQPFRVSAEYICQHHTL